MSLAPDAVFTVREMTNNDVVSVKLGIVRGREEVTLDEYKIV